jgi:hypothetical protein
MLYSAMLLLKNNYNPIGIAMLVRYVLPASVLLCAPPFQIN